MQGGDEIIHRQRFAYHPGHAVSVILRLVADKVGGEGYHGRQLALAKAPDHLVGNIEPGHIGQLDIQQEEIKRPWIGQGQRLGTIARHRDAMAQLFQQRRRHRDIELHILHQQDAQRRSGHGLLLHGCLQGLNLQFESKTAALPFITVHGQRAAHGLSQLARHRQANTGSHGMLATAHLIIHGKDVGLLLAGNADPRIFHLEAQVHSAAFQRRNIDPQGDTTILGEFHRIAGEIPEDLPQAGAISLNPVGQLAIQIEIEIEPLLLGKQLGQRLQIVQEGGEVHAARCYLQLAPIQFVQIYDVIEDIAQGDGAKIDGIEVLALLLFQPGIQQDAA